MEALEMIEKYDIEIVDEGIHDKRFSTDTLWVGSNPKDQASESELKEKRAEIYDILIKRYWSKEEIAKFLMDRAEKEKDVRLIKRIKILLDQKVGYLRYFYVSPKKMEDYEKLCEIFQISKYGYDLKKQHLEKFWVHFEFSSNKAFLYIDDEKFAQEHENEPGYERADEYCIITTHFDYDILKKTVGFAKNNQISLHYQIYDSILDRKMYIPQIKETGEPLILDYDTNAFYSTFDFFSEEVKRYRNRMDIIKENFDEDGYPKESYLKYMWQKSMEWQQL